MIRRHALATIGLAIALLSHQAVLADEAPAAKLSADQLRAELIGKTLDGEIKTGRSGGRSFTAYIGADGIERFKTSKYEDKGNYRITPDGQWCVTWEKLNDSREVFSTIHKSGDTYSAIRVGDSVVGSTWTVKPGNPNGF